MSFPLLTTDTSYNSLSATVASYLLPYRQDSQNCSCTAKRCEKLCPQESFSLIRKKKLRNLSFFLAAKYKSLPEISPTGLNSQSILTSAARDLVHHITASSSDFIIIAMLAKEISELPSSIKLFISDSLL